MQKPARVIGAAIVEGSEALHAHDGKNVGSGRAKVLATYIVETGKPVASPVK